jgi:hypothetical protein
MLFSSTTDAYGGLGGVATSFFSDIAPFIYIILGIALAFFIIEIIIGIVSRQKNVNSDINSK